MTAYSGVVTRLKSPKIALNRGSKLTKVPLNCLKSPKRVLNRQQESTKISQ
jgi:hypothetical protein